MGYEAGEVRLALERAPEFQRTAPNEGLAKSQNPATTVIPYRTSKRTVNGIDTAAEYTDGVCSRSLVFLIVGILALTND